MKVTQAYEIVNEVQKQFLGTEDIKAITNEAELVDVGNKFDKLDLLDKYVRAVINQIGKVIFDTRVYTGQAPSVYMDGVEYGSIVEKLRAEVPDAMENPSWNLTDGVDYNDSKFYQPKVHAKFFNEMDTWEVRMSFAYRQVMQSFTSATQLTAFFTMIENKINMSITMKNEGLIMSTISNFIAATMDSTFSDLSNLTMQSGVRAVNLLKEYKDIGKLPPDAQPEQFLTTTDFLRYAAYRIGTYSDYLTRASNRFNIGGTVKHTPREMQHLVLLSDFARMCDTFLQSNTFHEEFTKLPKSEHVSFWQGSGTDYEFSSLSDIHKNIKNPLNPSDGTTKEVAVSGILGCLFDRDALGVTNMNRRVRSKEVQEAEFYTNFYKVDARYFNDYDENFIVFFVA